MIDLKELRKLVKYLRKEGITEFKNGDLEFKLNAEIPKKRHKASVSANANNDVSDQVNIDSDYPTQEELLFFSAGGPPPKDS